MEKLELLLEKDEIIDFLIYKNKKIVLTPKIIECIEFENCKFENCDFITEKTNMDNYFSFRNCSFNNCTFDNLIVYVYDSILKNINLKNVSNVNFIRSKVINLTVKNQKNIRLSIEGSYILDANIEKTDFSAFNIINYETIEMEDSVVINSKFKDIKAEYLTFSNVLFHNLNIENIETIKSSSIKNNKIIESNLKNIKFKNTLNFFRNQLIKTNFENSNILGKIKSDLNQNIILE